MDEDHSAQDKMLRGRTLFITGGSSGIGYAIAEIALAKGARVAICGSNAERLDHACQSLGAASDQLVAVSLDVTNASAWAAVADLVEDRLGPIELLFLNAGVAPPHAAIGDATADEWAWVINTNVMGVANGLVALLPRMKARGTPARIVFTGSIASVYAFAGMAPYNASKAAVLAIGETLRTELAGSPIEVSVVMPAQVATDIARNSARQYPARAAGYGDLEANLGAGMPPSQVASFALGRVAEGQFYIFTHPFLGDELRQQYDELLRDMPCA